MSIFSSLKAMFSRASRPTGLLLPTGQVSNYLSKLSVLAYRTNSTKPVQLYCERLGPTNFMFQTADLLKEGECFELHILLPGQAPLKTTGQVKFTVHVGTLKGQIDMWTTGPQQHQIRQYVLQAAAATRSKRSVR
jgi:hypothetical protein